jgi:hypothetical protein
MTQLMAGPRKVAAIAALALAAAACDDADITRLQLGAGGFVETGDVTGFWTGSATLATAFPAPGEGDTYRVALTLDRSGWFSLRSDYPPTHVDPNAPRRCDGVWTLRGGVIEFFPDEHCPALALPSLNVRLRDNFMELGAFRTQPISTSLTMRLWRS